jgi:hypothetical protein
MLPMQALNFKPICALTRKCTQGLGDAFKKPDFVAKQFHPRESFKSPASRQDSEIQ